MGEREGCEAGGWSAVKAETLLRNWITETLRRRRWRVFLICLAILSTWFTLQNFQILKLRERDLPRASEISLRIYISLSSGDLFNFVSFFSVYIKEGTRKWFFKSRNHSLSSNQHVGLNVIDYGEQKFIFFTIQNMCYRKKQKKTKKN